MIIFSRIWARGGLLEVFCLVHKNVKGNNSFSKCWPELMSRALESYIILFLIKFRIQRYIICLYLSIFKFHQNSLKKVRMRTNSGEFASLLKLLAIAKESRANLRHFKRSHVVSRGSHCSTRSHSMSAAQILQGGGAREFIGSAFRTDISLFVITKCKY